MEITPEQLRSIQLKELEALIQMDEVCRKNGLRYYLAYGTLLGAIRHKGFIPWDDDLDIAMPRKDYDIFLKHGQQWLGDQFFLQNYRTMPQCAGQISEVRVNGTLMKQKMSEKSEIHHGVYIDVFPLDFVPQKPLTRSVERIILLALSTIAYAKMGHKSSSNRFFSAISQLLSLILPITTVRTMWDKIATKHESKPTGFVAGKPGFYYLCTKKEDSIPEQLYGTPIELEFEGKRFFAPEHPDAILEMIYGDYMFPPPEDQRELRHAITELKL